MSVNLLQVNSGQPERRAERNNFRFVCLAGLAKLERRTSKLAENTKVDWKWKFIWTAQSGRSHWTNDDICKRKELRLAAERRTTRSDATSSAHLQRPQPPAATSDAIGTVRSRRSELN